jgi:carbon-monoxide dehydrogenase small subunit
MRTTFQLNGQPVTADTQPGVSLLEYLREHEIYSVKYGCGHGECGSCAVLIDGQAMNACLILMHTLQGKQVETLESLNDQPQQIHLQEAFLEEGAIQCGYCTPGMLISLEALKRQNDSPDDAAIRDALAGNLCRCTGYVKPVRAAKRPRDGE